MEPVYPEFFPTGLSRARTSLTKSAYMYTVRDMVDMVTRILNPGEVLKVLPGGK